MPEIKSLSFPRLITHEIPLYNGSANDPKFSSRLINALQNDATRTLHDRLQGSLGVRSNSIEMEIVETFDGSVFDSILKSFKGDETVFIAESKRICRKLANSQQKKNIPGGTLIAMQGTTDSNRYPIYILIKAEEQNGFTKILDERNDVDLQYVDNLLLTPAQKLYKIASYIYVNFDDPESDPIFEVRVFDNNMTSTETRTAATYFYETFLGCTFLLSDRKLNEIFYTQSKLFIQHLPVEEEEKIDYHNALAVYMTDRAPTISSSEFASRHLPTTSIDEFTNHLSNSGFPLQRVPKNLSLLKNRIKKRKLNFSNDVRITAPAERFDELIRIQSTDTINNTTIIQINARILHQD